MERPTIFNETINKKTSSRNKSTIQYERGTLSQENRVFVENTINDAKFSKLPTGYDGSLIKNTKNPSVSKTPVINNEILVKTRHCLNFLLPNISMMTTNEIPPATIKIMM